MALKNKDIILPSSVLRLLSIDNLQKHVTRSLSNESEVAVFSANQTLFEIRHAQLFPRLWSVTRFCSVLIGLLRCLQHCRTQTKFGINQSESTVPFSCVFTKSLT